MTKGQKCMSVLIVISFLIVTISIGSLAVTHVKEFKYSRVKYDELNEESLTGTDVKVLDEYNDGSVIILYPEDMDDSEDYEVEVIYDDDGEVKAISVGGVGIVE